MTTYTTWGCPRCSDSPLYPCSTTPSCWDFPPALAAPTSPPSTSWAAGHPPATLLPETSPRPPSPLSRNLQQIFSCLPLLSSTRYEIVVLAPLKRDLKYLLNLVPAVIHSFPHFFLHLCICSLSKHFEWARHPVSTGNIKLMVTAVPSSYCLLIPPAANLPSAHGCS